MEVLNFLARMILALPTMQDNLNGRADWDGLWIEPQKRSEAGTSRNLRGMSAPELTQESSA